MKRIKIKFVDFWPGFDLDSNFIVKTLSIKYEVIQVESPDYLFFSCFGFTHLSYECVKKLFVGENLVPDFNICDYALGFDYLSFGDRYLRLPLYVTYDSFECLKESKLIDNEKLLNREFCSIVVSNNHLADPMRERFFQLLSEYKKIDSGGRAWNNIGGPVDNKYEFIAKYKFNIAFENSSVMGYTTEKIMEPMTVGSIPIYWGNPLISNEFNTKSFVNLHDFKSLEEVVEKIMILDTIEEEYLKVLKEPWIVNDDILKWREKLLDFLSSIIEKPLCSAKYLVKYGRSEMYRRNMLMSEWCNNRFKIGRWVYVVKESLFNTH